MAAKSIHPSISALKHEVYVTNTSKLELVPHNESLYCKIQPVNNS
jgi:hypothetical protein